MNTFSLLKTINNQVKKNDKNIEVLFNEPYMFFLYKKTERISSALYLITEHLKDGEPIKDRIRYKAVEIIEIVLSCKKTVIQKNDLEAKTVIGGYLTILSYINTAVISGLVKETNYFILQGEINSLLQSFSDHLTSNTLIEGDLKGQLLNIETKEISKGQVNLKDSTNITKKVIIKDNLKDIKLTTSKDVFSVKNALNKNGLSSNTEKKKDRRGRILNLFSTGSKYSIKDISILIPDFSEKTVQRELNSLVDENVLNKEGDRRWTRYFLK